MINAQSKTLNVFIVLDCLNISVYTGTLIPVITEAMDTILKAMNTINQVRIAKPSINFKPGTLIDSPSSIPKVVATPLPPLNLKNTVQLWPKTELMPKRIRRFCSRINGAFKVATSAIKTTGIKPFTISKINTEMPAALPNTRKAFVAPTLPEPN